MQPDGLTGPGNCFAGKGDFDGCVALVWQGAAQAQVVAKVNDIGDLGEQIIVRWFGVGEVHHNSLRSNAGLHLIAWLCTIHV
jgi:hypothetical protein